MLLCQTIRGTFVQKMKKKKIVNLDEILFLKKKFRGSNIVIESLYTKLWPTKFQISTFNLSKKIFISGSSIISFIKSLIIHN